MGRIKWNLDQLEKVEKQHEKALDITEQIINKGRSDLASMTEEVWEGEDADMARDQYRDLVYKEMPETWNQLETCNEYIKEAQKTANESKNFCNDFPQIFRSGSMPSDTNSSTCGGDLMCDEDGCESLKADMDAAGENAKNIKSYVESAESILAQLETDFAKFDYTSYTRPIKEQTQKVADRTATYCEGVSRYEQKTQDMDNTFSKGLLSATPDTVPEPLDPSILLSEDLVHMKEGDIINFLEEYNIIKPDKGLDEAQIENIMKLLFDKKDADISDMSEQDLGLAFINLPEEKKKEVLAEMGYTEEQIESILESCKDDKASATGSSIARTLIEKIKENDKMSQQKGGGQGLAKTLGLAGLRKPGAFEKGNFKPGTEKTHAETLSGDEKEYGKTSSKNKNKNNKKTKDNSTGNNSNSGGTSTTPSGNGIETTPEEVQEWVESGDTASMNAYIEETSQNVDEWDSNRAANLGTIYEWSLQSGNTEVAEKFANHFRIEVSVTDGENSDTQIHTYAMNEEAMNAIIDAIPQIPQNNYEDIDGTARETLEQLKQWEGTVEENKKTGATTDLQNISVSLNEKYQMVFSYKKCSGDTVTITSDQSIVVDTPKYIVDYWLNNDDKEIVKAYIDATPKEVSDWEQERNYNLATIFDWAVNNQEMEVLECENKLFFSNDLIYRDIRWGTTCYRDNRTYSIVGHGSVIEAIRNALRYQNKTGSEAYEILGKFYEYATLPAEDLQTFAIEYTSSDPNADIDAWKPASAGWYGYGFGIEYYYKNSITKDEFGNLIFQFGYKNGPYLENSIIDGFKYVSEYLPADLKIEDIVDLSTGDIKPRYVHNFYVKDANKVPDSVYTVFESLLNRIGNASTDSVFYGGKTLSQLLNVDGLFKLVDPDESLTMCKYTTSFSELVKRFYEDTIKDSKNSIFLTDYDLEEDEYIRATNTLTLALTLQEIDSALQEFFGYSPDGIQPMFQNFTFEYSSDKNFANSKWEIWDITSNYYLGNFPKAIKVNAFGSENSLGQQLNNLQDEYLKSMKQSIPVTVGTNAEFWLIGLSDPCYCIPTTILSTLLSIVGNVDNNSKVETCISINDISNAVDAMRLKGQIVTHYNSDGSVESFELTNLFYDEEELQNQVDAYNESLIQTQSSNLPITVEDLITSFTHKLFNPDATDEELKAIDCYTEWYGQH